MDNGGVEEEGPPVGELFSRLIDDGKAYAKAEFDLVKVSAENKADAIKRPALLGAAALLFVIAGVVMLCMTIVLSLATLIGPLAGGLVATLAAFGTAGLLLYLAKRQWQRRK